MRNVIFILFALSVLFIAGCETKYQMLTDDGIVEVPLSKALEMAQSPRELYPLLSDAITLEDRRRIEARIEELRSYEPPEGVRGYRLGQDVHEQTQRRITYVRTNEVDYQTKQVILSGGFIEGMSKDEFIASRGEPIETRTIQDDGKTIEVLIEGSIPTRSYYFVNDKLSHWD